MLRPVRAVLATSLRDMYADPKKPESMRQLATNLLAEYVHDRPGTLVELLEDADSWQFDVIFARLRNHRTEAVERLHQTLIRTPGAAGTQANKQANAAG